MTNFTGLIVGAACFFLIGIFHPIVIKAEYHFGKKFWIAFLLGGILSAIASILILNSLASFILGVLSFCCFWSIVEMFEQEKRVLKGWFPKNPNRKYPNQKNSNNS